MRENDLLSESEPDPAPYDSTDDDAETRRILAILERQPVWFDPNDALTHKNIPNIYTSAEWIDRAEAERMLRYYLASMGYHNVRFNWKRPDFVVNPA
jgi:hypothetical protein